MPLRDLVIYNFKTKTSRPFPPGATLQFGPDETVQVNADGVGSVLFDWDNGALRRPEDWSPYHINGDNTPLPARLLADGKHRLVVTACMQRQGQVPTNDQYVRDFTIGSVYTPSAQAPGFFKGLVSPWYDKPDQALALLKALHCSPRVRFWQTVYGESISDAQGKLFEQMRQMRAAGIHVTLCCSVRVEAPFKSAASTAAWFKSAMAYKDCVDAWEIGNEPNLKQYWQNGDIKSFWENYAKPAVAAIREFGKGETIVGPACTGSSSSVKAFVDMGYVDLFDVCSYHSYGVDEQNFIDNTRKVRNFFGTKKPLWLTESNIFGCWRSAEKGGPMNDQEWAAAQQTMYSGIHGLVEGVYYFCTRYGTNDPIKRAALVEQDGRIREPYYSAFKNLVIRPPTPNGLPLPPATTTAAVAAKATAAVAETATTADTATEAADVTETAAETTEPAVVETTSPAKAANAPTTLSKEGAEKLAEVVDPAKPAGKPTRPATPAVRRPHRANHPPPQPPK